jgi:hypothetical protein
MTLQQRWTVLACSVVVCAAVLGDVFAFGRFGTHHQEEKVMNTTCISVDHVHLVTDKAFEDVTKVFERQLGKFDPDVRRAVTESGHTEAAKAKIEAMAGPSGFMLFSTQDHGGLLRLAGQKRKAMQYVVGNPLIALQMTHQRPVSLPRRPKYSCER